jgi:hypothetical protein
VHRPEGWRPSPAYDLTPDEPVRGEHVLAFGSCGCRPNAAGLAELGRGCGLSRQAARGIRGEVAAAVGGWRQRFAAHGVGEADIGWLAPAIDRRRVACGED